MPNWNVNYMDVKGKEENVKTVLNFIKENYSTEKVSEKEYIYILDFEKFLPTPLDDKGEIIEGWYEWRYENWGCKWSPCSDQYNYLEVEYKDGKKESFDYHMENEFNETNIDKLLENVENINEIKLENSFYTPWCPPYSIISKWSETYKDIDLVNKYYEPGCCFAGKMGFNNEEGLYDECYDSRENEKYITFLLQEDLESIDWYIELVYDLMLEMYEDKGVEFIEKLRNKVYEQLKNEKYEFNQAKLICEICDKYDDFMTNKNKESKVEIEVQPKSEE